MLLGMEFSGLLIKNETEQIMLDSSVLRIRRRSSKTSKIISEQIAVSENTDRAFDLHTT
jgi:hypothetical protein